jgi:hypothetical protein
MTTHEEPVPAPAELLDEMDRLRRQARADRRAPWFPLLVFGLIEIGSTPLYWGDRAFLLGPVLQLALLSVVAIGVVLTVLWYRRRADRIGVQTATRGPVMTFAGASVVVLVIGAIPFAFLLGALAFRGTDWLVVVAAGLLALAIAERNALLFVIAVLHAGAAALGALYNVENLLFDVLGWFGVSDRGQPYQVGAALNVLLPGIVLLLGALVTFARNRRAAR